MLLNKFEQLASKCGLFPNDIKDLSRAAQEGKLSKLTVLNLSFNPKIVRSLKLLCTNWPSLESIILGGITKMKAGDVSNLVAACGGAMPNLRFIACEPRKVQLFESHQSELSRKGLRVEYYHIVEDAMIAAEVFRGFL